jgi:hypothetical protein
VIIQEFLALSDREKDVLIARTVMKRKVRFVGDDKDPSGWDDWYFDDEELDASSMQMPTQMPFYTTSDADSCRVADRMIADGFNYCLMYRQARKRWQATFDGMTYEAFAPTRALAIALAALKALGVIDQTPGALQEGGIQK